MTKKKPATNRVPKRCAFCDGTDLTEEHLWPKWIKRVVADLDRKNHHSATFLTWNFPASNVRTPEIDTRRITGPARSQKVKAFCASCNNEWMSKIENSTKGLLTGLIQDTIESLSVADQKLLHLGLH